MGYEDDYEDYEDLFADPWAACGRSLDSKVTISNLGRGQDLAHGVDSQPGEFPHMCVIYKRLSTGELTYLGGGSLIARNKILTVAHKFYVIKGSVDERDNLENIVVRCGEY